MLQQREKLGKSSLACETPESSQHICGCQHHHHPLHRSASCTSPSSAPPPLQPPHPRGKNTSLPSRVRRPDPSSSLLTLHSLADLVFLYTVTESKSRKKKCRRNPGSFMENWGERKTMQRETERQKERPALEGVRQQPRVLLNPFPKDKD